MLSTDCLLTTHLLFTVERRLELLLLPVAQAGAAVGGRYGGGAPGLVEEQQRGAAHLGHIGLQAEYLGLHVGGRAEGQQQRGAAHVLDVEDAVAVDVTKEAARPQRALTAAALGLGLQGAPRAAPVARRARWHAERGVERVQGTT